MKNINLKISIITVTLNCKSFIVHNINSVNNQSYDNIEHIIIDGGSSDGTRELIKNNKSRLLKIISEPDKGIYDALNKGISISTGNIIGILHSDDLFVDQEVLNLVNQTFVSNPDVEVVIGDILFFDKSTSNQKKRVIRSGKFKPWMLRFGFMPAHTATFLRRSAIKKLGNYRNNYESAGDFEFFIRIFKVNKLRYNFLNKIIIKMRLGGTSTSGMRSYLRTSSEILKALKQHNIYSNIFFVLARLPIKWFGQLLLGFQKSKK